MKKTTLLFACAAAVLAFAGCSKENVGNDVKSNKIKVSFAAEREDVKSVLNGKSVSWATDDLIDVYDGTTQNTFTYSGGEFDGTVTGGATDFYAIYPKVFDTNNGNTRKTSKFEKLQTVEGKDSVICRTFLQSCQKPVKDSFSPFANLAAGTPTLDGDMLSGNMINLCSYFKFTISSEKINRVIFKSSYNRRITGVVYVSFANGEITTEGDEAPYVECACNGTDAIAPGTYYLCVLPESYGYIEVSLSDTDGNIYELKTKSIVKCARNEIANFGTIDENLASRKTDKLSLFYNFMTASNLSGYATGSSKTTNVTLTLGGKEYTSEHYYNYARSGYFTWGASGYMNSPAIEGYALDQVVLSLRGHNNNCTATLKIYPGDGTTTEEYCGAYKIVKDPKFTGIDSRFAIGTCNNKMMYWAHIFTFGKNSPAEMTSSKIPEWAKSGARPNTSYRIKNSGSGGFNINSAELIYRKVESPE